MIFLHRTLTSTLPIRQYLPAFCGTTVLHIMHTIPSFRFTPWNITYSAVKWCEKSWNTVPSPHKKVQWWSVRLWQNIIIISPVKSIKYIHCFPSFVSHSESQTQSPSPLPQLPWVSHTPHSYWNCNVHKNVMRAFLVLRNIFVIPDMRLQSSPRRKYIFLPPNYKTLSVECIFMQFLSSFKKRKTCGSSKRCS